MNKIYRIIWNKLTGRFVVTSELAKSCGKSATTGTVAGCSRAIARLALLPASVLCGLSGYAMAEQTAPIRAGGKTVEYSDVNISTTTANNYASNVQNKGVLTINGGSLTTSAYYAYAAYIQGGGKMFLDGVTMKTGGTYAYAISAINGAYASAKNSNMTTTGANGHAVYADSGSQVDLENVNVTTTSRGANAITSRAASSLVNYNGGSITTAGNGLLAHTSGAISASDLNITLTQAGYSALSVSNDGVISLSGSQIATTANGNVTGISSSAGAATATLTGTQMDLPQGTAIAVTAGTQTVNTSNSVLNSTLLIRAGYGAVGTVVDSVILTGDNNSRFTGDIDINRAQTTSSTLTLNNASAWTGKTANLQNLNLNGGSQWDVTDSSSVDHVALDNATLNMTAHETGFSQLTVGDLTSNNGTIKFHTHLMDDSSQTDHLQITGDYTGNTNVVVSNAGGTGAQTLHGIELIDVQGKVNGTFTQQGRIVAGAYDYQLVQGSGADASKWLLESDVAKAEPVIKPADPTGGTKPVDPVDGTSPVNPTNPGNGSGQEVAPASNRVVHIVRPEAGSYAANLAAANTLFNGSRDSRLGETSYVDALGQKQVTSLWLRNEGGHTRSEDTSGQLKTTGNRYVMQMGGDIAQWSSNGADRFHLGVMGGYANAQSKTRSKISGYSAEAQVHGYSTGVYGSWVQDNAESTGAYADSWALYNWFDNSVKGDDIGEESYKSKGITASVETGYTFKVGQVNQRQSYYVQPQAQATWMGVKADNVKERNGTNVSSTGHNNVQTRLGVRAFIKGHSQIDEAKQRTFEPFIEANWLHNSEQFGSSMNGIGLHQAGTRNIAEVKVGVDAKLGNKVNLWGNIGQQVGNNSYSDSSAMVGVKVNF